MEQTRTGNNRDDFSQSIKLTLAKRVNFFCSNPDCNCQTFCSHSEKTKATGIGVAAHITAAAPGGPRYDASLSEEERKSIDNGIWLCENCAKKIDKDEKKYPVSLLREWKKEAEKYALEHLGKPQGRKRKKPTILLTPFPKRKIQLLGRERDLKELEEKIKQSQCRLLVNGMGGIGKTEVCKRFFYDHYFDYPYAAWIDYTGSFKQSLTNAFKPEKAGITDTSNADDQFNRIIKYINGLDGELLLVVDNISKTPADDAELELLFRFPQYVRVIATSRLTIEGFEVYPLDVLSEASCIQLFYAFYKGKPDNESVKEIIRLSGFHTLTVELLARTAQNSMKPVKVLLDILKKKGFNLSDAIPETIGTFYGDETLQKKFFDHLLTLFELTNVTKNEEHLLSNISVLPALYISVEQIKDWLQLENVDDINSSIKKGWLKADDNFNIYMHPVIQEVVRQRTKPDSSKCAKLIGSLILKLKKEPGDNPIDKVRFVIFGESVLRYIHDETEDVATLANNLSMIYKDMGQLEQALEYQLKANAIFEKVLDENRPLRATSYNNLSMIYKDMGQLEQALEFQLKAITIREKILEAQHPDFAQSYNNLSNIYQAMGQLEQALEFQLKANAIYEKIFDENHLQRATSYNNLSQIYLSMGKLEQAQKLGLKVNTMFEKILAENHPLRATSYNNLSKIYHDMGQLEQAKEFGLKANAMFEKILAENHPLRATSYNNLSQIYLSMGQLEQAKELGLKANAMFEKILGENHPNLATSYNNLSQIYLSMGQLELALEYQLKALTIREKVLGAEHPSLASSYNELSLIYKNIGKVEQALEFQLKANLIYEKGLGTEHPYLATSYNNLSLIYKDMGKLEQALEFGLKSNALYEKALGEEHPDLATSYNNLSLVYKEMGQLDKAIPYMQKAIAILEKVFPNGHPNLDIMKENREILLEEIRKNVLTTD